MSRESIPIIDLSTLASSESGKEDRVLDFLRILDLVPDAMIAVRADGSIAFASRRTEELFGYERSELVGQPIEILLPQRHQALHRQHRAGFFASRRERSMETGLDLWGQKKDGAEFPADIALSRARIGDEEIAIAAVRDITERKMMAERLENVLTRVLEGFIPICASCKKIRQADETWVRLERYLADHSEARFSHSICPVCEDALYPGEGEEG